MVTGAKFLAIIRNYKPSEKKMATESELSLLAALATKVNRVAASLGDLEPDGYNSYGRYGYVTSSRINSILNTALEECSLAVIPSFDSYEEKIIEKPTENGAARQVRSIVSGTLLLVDCETGYSMPCGMIGADQDAMGKSMAQAETDAIKRALGKIFRFSTRGDRDPDSFGGTPSAEPVQDCPGPYLPAGQSSVPGQGRLYGDWRGKGFISVPQQKRFYAICRQRGMDEPAIIAWLSGNGLASIADIQQSQYDQLTAAVK